MSSTDRDNTAPTTTPQEDAFWVLYNTRPSYVEVEGLDARHLDRKRLNVLFVKPTRTINFTNEITLKFTAGRPYAVKVWLVETSREAMKHATLKATLAFTAVYGTFKIETLGDRNMSDLIKEQTKTKVRIATRTMKKVKTEGGSKPSKSSPQEIRNEVVRNVSHRLFETLSKDEKFINDLQLKVKEELIAIAVLSAFSNST